MFSKTMATCVVCLIAYPATGLAHEQGFFAGIDTSVGIARGSSSTTNGGGFGLGGKVKDVKFGNTLGIGVHAGYQFDQSLSAFVSYQHIRGDIDWAVEFPGQTIDISGTATSNAVLLNLAYDWRVSEATSIKTAVGAGVSFNTLSKMTETYQGQFVSNPEKHTKVSPSAQLSASLQHYLTPNTVLGLGAAVAYTGGFRTGNTRTGNLGRTDINPYKIDNVWRASLGASMQIRF